MSGFYVVIPARYASSRLPGKALRELAGKPMIAYAWEAARASAAKKVLVATDDRRIAAACERFGADVVMTAGTHPSGSDRIAELAERLGWEDHQVVVNVQCDEPLLPPQLVDQVAAALSADGDIATLATPFVAGDDVQDPNAVKVVINERSQALYFSRAAIPFHRDQPGSAQGTLRHLGLYAYRVDALRRLCSLPVCELEQLERLEQLRALWAGMTIDVAIASTGPGPGVDTEEDLRRVAEMLEKHQ